MKYLVNWKNDTCHSAVMTIAGIHRLLSAAYEKNEHLQVCVWKLAENEVFATPIPLRVWYDFKFDKLSLFSLSGDCVEISQHKNSGILKREAA